jgi:hypothetical protein
MIRRRAALSVTVACWLAAAHAQGEEAREVVVWYRNGAQCPDGAGFLKLLEQHAVRARLATVGDRVDFVVTLGTDARGHVGRLERQTQRGTVAIRDLMGDDCLQVADALALSLGLAAASEDPSAGIEASSPTQEGTRGATSGLGPAPADPTTLSAPRSSTDAPVTTPLPVLGAQSPAALPLGASIHPNRPAVPMPSEHGGPPDPFDETGWLVSAGALVSMGSAPDPLWGLSGHVSWYMPRSGVLAPSARLRLGWSSGSSETSRGDLDTEILSYGAHGCPTRFGKGHLRLEPCLGLDFGRWTGEVRSDNGLLKHRFWATASLQARAAWVQGWFVAEIEGGLVAPLRRYRLVFERPSESVFVSPVLGASGSASVAVRIP